MSKSRSGKITPEAYRESLAHIQSAVLEAKDDEAKLKPLLKELKDSASICGAFIRKEGTICIEQPHVAEDGRTNGRCWTHGGGSTGPVSIQVMKEDAARLHPKAQGVYMISVDRFIMTAAENSFYIDSMNTYIDEYNLDLVNIILLDRALRNFFMNSRKEIARAGETVPESRSNQDFDTKSLRYFQALGFDRKFTQSIANADNSQKIDLAQVFTLQGSAPERKEVVLENKSVNPKIEKARAKITGEKRDKMVSLDRIAQKLPNPVSKNLQNISTTEDEEDRDDDPITGRHTAQDEGPLLDKDDPEEEILDE